MQGFWFTISFWATPWNTVVSPSKAFMDSFMFISELGWQSCGARKATCRQHNCCWNCWDKSKEEKAEGKKSCCKVAKVLQVEEEERVWKNGSRRKNLVQIEEGEHPILFLYVHTNGCKVLTGWQQWKPITGSAVHVS